jgi:hypothetical protein
MATTVVFFDDAEGEIQNYAERKGSDYYPSSSSYLPGYSHYPAYTGTGKSIVIGGSSNAKLRLTLNLDRKAKLSFWYANKVNGKEDISVFFIDGTQQMAWQGDYNWAYQEYTLEAGTREVVWIKDGYYSSPNFGSFYSYLSLDNILVFYIE